MMSAHCLIFPFGGYDLHTTLALGLGFLCHGALHVVGEAMWSLISTAVTCVPHGSVWPWITFLICSLMLAVSERS